MNSILGAILKAMNIGQVIAFLFSTGGPIIINALVPAGPVRDAAISVCASVGALLMVLLRTPSAAGGAASTSGK